MVWFQKQNIPQLLILILGFIAPFDIQASYTSSTFAGNYNGGIPGFSGDGSLATSTSTPTLLNQPNAICQDATGNIYIVDTVNNVARKVNANNFISTIAGNQTTYTSGSPVVTGGYGGDGHFATAAYLNNPQGICVDNAGFVYIADTLNNVIRFILSPLIDTVAGTQITYSPGGTPQAGGFSGDGGAATSASLNSPCGLCLDNTKKYLYIADSGNHAIRMINLNVSPQTITTVAGTGGSSGYSVDPGPATSALLNTPSAICLDASGNLYIADTGNNVVRFVYQSNVASSTYTTGNIYTIAGQQTAYMGSTISVAGGNTGDGGSPTSALLNSPSGISLDSLGNIYIADTANNRIRKINSSFTTITAFSGTGTAGYLDSSTISLAQFNGPRGIFVDKTSNVYVADTLNNVIRKLISPGTTYIPGTDENNSAIPRQDVISIGGSGGFSAYAAPLANTRTLSITLTQTGIPGISNSIACSAATFPNTLKELRLCGDATYFDLVCGTGSGLPTPPANCNIRFMLTTGPTNPCSWFQSAIPASCCVYIQPGSADPMLTTGILDVPCNLNIGNALSSTSGGLNNGVNGGISIPAAISTVNSIISVKNSSAHPILTLNANTIFANAVHGVSLSGHYTATFNKTSDIYAPTLTGTNKISKLIIGPNVTLTVNSSGAYDSLPLTFLAATSKCNISGANP